MKLTGGKKLVAMSENDTIPRVSNLINERAGWLYFCPWYGWWLTGEQNNPVDWLIEMYQSDYCITLDELPDLKAYPISDYDDPTPNPSPTTTMWPEFLYGDLNGDKKVNSTDLSYMKRYILKITPSLGLPERVADLNQDSRVNSTDYSILQRYLLRIIPNLPVEYQ
ncbi:mannan endo-1,4-beta-mannosidase [Acetivibrio straminisolvens JCM 21531]|uniref:Mannan endo-1,4-beta-mannosidase n=1 Tax=Acetivibrio straminisolvens JCM 21531 TaxID=1294263 RepID=W4V487_9FIRM|nr:mannan endo-1,4-beta-mannosidase [Acetivibrio straminisolvens JCM 21531]